MQCFAVRARFLFGPNRSVGLIRWGAPIWWSNDEEEVPLSEILQLLGVVVAAGTLFAPYLIGRDHRLSDQAARLNGMAELLREMGPPPNVGMTHAAESERKHDQQIDTLQEQARIAVAGYSMKVDKARGSGQLAAFMFIYGLFLAGFGVVGLGVFPSAGSGQRGVDAGFVTLIVLGIALVVVSLFQAQRIRLYRAQKKAVGLVIDSPWEAFKQNRSVARGRRIHAKLASQKP